MKTFKGSFIKYVRKIFRITNISYSLIRARKALQIQVKRLGHSFSSGRNMRILFEMQYIFEKLGAKGYVNIRNCYSYKKLSKVHHFKTLLFIILNQSFKSLLFLSNFIVNQNSIIFPVCAYKTFLSLYHFSVGKLMEKCEVSKVT